MPKLNIGGPPLEKIQCTVHVYSFALSRSRRFFSSKLWMGDDRGNKDVNYDSTIMQDLSKMENAMATMIMETINNMLIELYATIAHAEMEKREKRQREGIQAMKERGEWEKYGRPRKCSFEKFCKEYSDVVSGEVRPFELMHKLGLTKPTFYRYKKQYDENKRG